MSDVFDEIEEDLRRDRLEDAWKKYGKFVIGAAAAVVIVTAGYTGWRQYQASRVEDMASRYDLSVIQARDGNLEQAIATLAPLAEDTGEGYGILANLRRASLLLEQGDKDGAVASLDALANNADAPALYRGLALVLSVSQQADNAAPQDLLARLEPQLADDAPWRFTARELAATLALRAGDKDQALTYLKQISDDADAPQAVRQRASELLKAIEA